METKNLLNFVLGLIFVFGITSCSEDEVFDEQSLLETENAPRMYIKTYAKNYYENGEHAGNEHFILNTACAPGKGAILCRMTEFMSTERIFLCNTTLSTACRIISR